MSVKSILKTLRIIAEDVTPVSNARIAAAVVYKGDIISIGVNQHKSHPMQAKFSKNKHAIFLHAEIDAINKALRRIDKDALTKCELYIMRRRKINGIFVDALSKPCSGCQRAIETYGITKIIYSEYN